MPSLVNPTYRQHRSYRSLVSWFFLILWLALLGWAALNRQNLIDWWRLQNYHVPAAIATLASEDTLTDYARKIFYVNRPAIDDKTTFSTSEACPNNGGEQTIVLGCYRGGQGGIFVLEVDDPRLDGVQQVTAAHEMLHAAYDRLGSEEKQKINAMLLDYYQHDLHDERILRTIEAYKKSEPKDVVNEMHSIFGTEVAQLPRGLEDYYRRYFTQRSRVAAYAAQYQSAFTSRRTLIAQYDSELASLKSQIDTGEADLKSKRQDIDDQQNSLMSQKNNNDVTAYNAGVPVFNALVDTYNREVQSVQNLIAQYNQLVANRNAVVLEQDQLSTELNSKETQIQQ